MTANVKSPRKATGHALHIGIAESGKLRALEGDHTDALRHYKEALRLAQTTRAPEVFFRHYTQCVLESLEHTGAYGEVIDFCENALAHFDALKAPLALHLRDQAAMLERYALNLIKAERHDDARAPLEKAVSLVAPDELPISRTVLDWLRRGMHADFRRITQLQAKYNYFSVATERVDPARAVPLPEPVQNAEASIL